MRSGYVKATSGYSQDMWEPGHPQGISELGFLETCMKSGLVSVGGVKEGWVGLGLRGRRHPL